MYTFARKNSLSPAILLGEHIMHITSYFLILHIFSFFVTISGSSKSSQIAIAVSLMCIRDGLCLKQVLTDRYLVSLPNFPLYLCEKNTN